jgi:hypothetical protein
MWLTFLGAAGTVTGSRLLVEHDGRRLLVEHSHLDHAVVPRQSERVRT